MKYGTLRNIFSSLRRTRQIQIAFKTNQTFYTLPGITFGRMTPYHTGVLSSSSAANNDSLYRLIQDLPIGKNALHDIHLRFNVEGIWSLLSASGSFKINSFSKDIRLPVWEIRGLSIKTTVHSTDTVSVVVGGSYYPIAVDFNGLMRLSNALTSVEERLSNLIQESSISPTPTGKQDDGRLVPDHMGWIVTMWHFGVDGLTEYTGEKFSCTWEVGQNALIRAYAKDFRDGKTHIRLERQEYPRRSLAYAIEEKINSSLARTWSTTHLLSNGPQSELIGKYGISRSRKMIAVQENKRFSKVAEDALRQYLELPKERVKKQK
jgi:hypothetical protein